MIRPILLVLSLLLSFQASATMIEGLEINALYDSFNKANYDQALEQSRELINDLEKQTPQPKDKLGLLHYWRGLCFNRKKDYAKALINFEKSIKYQFKAKDLLYEYGKALYALGELDQAQKVFADSYQNKYQTSLSLFYLGIIAEELEESKKQVAPEITPQEVPTKTAEVPQKVKPTVAATPPAPVNVDAELGQVYEAFKTGLYDRANRQLQELKEKVKLTAPQQTETLGLIAYWQGLNYNRQMDYTNATPAFESALSFDFKAPDLQYEYAQALYGSERLPEAIAAFQESFKQQFKPGVSLYYMAFLMQESGDKYKANEYYQLISTLSEEEKKEVEQASQMQIATMQLELIEAKPDAIRGVEAVVIPQFRKAMALDKDSNLAKEMSAKIRELQEKYELVLFKMRNNRPTQVPPYFLRASLDNAFDDNVVYSADETQISQSQKASSFTKLDVMGRYSYYLKNIMSFSPELRTNRTRYHNRNDTIQANDNYAIVPAVRTAYEHTLWNRPASHLFDYEYNYAHRDLNAEDKLIFSSRTQTYMLGERFNLLSNGETIVRYRQRHFDSYLAASNSVTNSFVLEQILSLKSGHMLILMGSYDQARNNTDLFNTNALMTRMDVIFPRYKDWFTPTVGMGLTFTDPYNNSSRGLEKLINPSVKLTRTISPRMRATFRLEYWKNNSNATSFQYTKQATGVELEYVF
jgi:predicted Zn-dependent protease